VHFGLVELWYMIRQFRIHLNFLKIFFKMFVSTRGPLLGLRPTRNCGWNGALNAALKTMMHCGFLTPHERAITLLLWHQQRLVD